jgi:predicted enzyme related to lactoylglutathione lyase
MDVTAILPMLDMKASVAFYEAAGFDVRVYRDDQEDGGYAFVSYNDESVFDLGLQPSAVGAGCFIIVADADVWHARLSALGYDVTPVIDEPWGMREFALTDPSGNRLRFGHNRG